MEKVTVHAKYVNIYKFLEQDFIVTNGITEMCIFGIDAIFLHEFVLCGKTKAIFIAGKEEEKRPLAMKIGKCRQWKWKFSFFHLSFRKG